MELTAKIKQEQLQEAIDKAALKGAVDVINEYYTGYNSPYKKALNEELKKKPINLIGLDLPDIIGLINDKMKKEIKQIANNAVDQTYLPMLQTSLFAHDKSVNFSEIIKKLITVHDIDYSNQDKWEIIINDNSIYGWLEVSIEDKGEKLYSFVMYHQGNEKYKIDSLPKPIKNKDFYRLISSLIISDSEIDLDCEGFEDWMFGEKCNC